MFVVNVDKKRWAATNASPLSVPNASPLSVPLGAFALVLYNGGDVTMPTIDVLQCFDSINVTSVLFSSDDYGRFVVMKSYPSERASSKKR